MVSIARLSVVKQSPFGLPGQYNRRVTRVNCSHQRGQRWKTVCILLQGLSSVDVLSVRRILRRLQHRYSNDLLCFGFVFPSFLSFLFFSFFVSFACFSSIFQEMAINAFLCEIVRDNKGKHEHETLFRQRYVKIQVGGSSNFTKQATEQEKKKLLCLFFGPREQLEKCQLNFFQCVTKFS